MDTKQTSLTTKQLTSRELDNLCVDTIRFLSVDAVQKANSGHPGLPLDAAPMAYVLWTRFLKHNPDNPKWIDRDRFVLSAGHGSMLLYSMLHLTGYALPLDQIKLFRQWGSMTPGHPERGLTPGVEITTGPLGQGMGNGIGMAIAEAFLSARFNKPGYKLIDHYTYGIVSDGDLMEGVGSESASLAGHLKLGKLIYLYDNNHITLSASTKLAFTEDPAKRFEAYGWDTQTIEDGNDLDAIERAIQNARQQKERPSLIIIRTHIGYGSPNKQDTFEAHGSPLGEEEVKLTKENLGWPEESQFHIPQEALNQFRQALDKGHFAEDEWNNLFADYQKEYPELAAEFELLIKGELPQNWDSDLPHFQADNKGMATRKASEKILESFQHKLPGLIGGSADLNPSTLTELKGGGNFSYSPGAEGDLQGSADGGWNYSGRNIFFGVREHAMGAIINGMAAHKGLIPFGATFLTFSDYMRPAIRLASIMELHVVYVFTHDSIGMGEDGPTHQPIEHLASLRAMPGIVVIRPADANETVEAWRYAIEEKEKPVALILTRQSVPVLDRNELASEIGLVKGGYVLADSQGEYPQLILIASGSEVPLIVETRKRLLDQHIGVRLVSMPSWELFEEQTQEYRDSVLPPAVVARISVEAGSSFGWQKYTGTLGENISIDHFGASAPGPVILREFGFTVDHILQRALKLLERNKNG
jgi:transketolase